MGAQKKIEKSIEKINPGIISDTGVVFKNEYRVVFKNEYTPVSKMNTRENGVKMLKSITIWKKPFFLSLYSSLIPSS